MKKILITGGAGFIGANLVKKLINDDNQITIFDNLYTGLMDNIAEFEKSDNIKFINGDINADIGNNIQNDTKYDQIYHLASPSSTMEFLRDPVYTIQTNINGTINVLDTANRCDCPVVIASGAEVYGDPLMHPQSEDYNGNVCTTDERACYEESKRMTETISLAFYRRYGTRVKIARIFNTYGPYMRPDDGRVVSSFIINALNGKPLVIHGRGDQKRSLCYVEDIIDGLISYMNSHVIGVPINFGFPHQTSIMELTHLIEKITGNEITSRNDYTKRIRTENRLPDINKAKSLLDWEPNFSLEQGLEKTADYFRKKLAADNNLT